MELNTTYLTEQENKKARKDTMKFVAYVVLTIATGEDCACWLVKEQTVWFCWWRLSLGELRWREGSDFDKLQ